MAAAPSTASTGRALVRTAEFPKHAETDVQALRRSNARQAEECQQARGAQFPCGMLVPYRSRQLRSKNLGIAEGHRHQVAEGLLRAG